MIPLKKLVFIPIVALLAACSSSKKVATTGTPKSSKGPEFVEGISINGDSSRSNYSSASPVYHSYPSVKKHLNSPISSDIERSSDIQFKYAILMNLPVESILNARLFDYLEEWYGTPYRYGGTSHDGVDCSAFSGFLLKDVYGINLPRSSHEQYSYSKRIKKSQLKEGDLIFFNTRGKISHVGVFLGNNKFAHASTSSGVMISDLNEDYFARRYAGAGRVIIK